MVHSIATRDVLIVDCKLGGVFYSANKGMDNLLTLQFRIINHLLSFIFCFGECFLSFLICLSKRFLCFVFCLDECLLSSYVCVNELDFSFIDRFLKFYCCVSDEGLSPFTSVLKHFFCVGCSFFKENFSFRIDFELLSCYLVSSLLRL